MDQSTMGALWQTDSSKNVVPTERVDEAPLPEKPPRSPSKHGWGAFWLLLLIILIVLGLAAAKEMRTSKFQARELSKYRRHPELRAANPAPAMPFTTPAPARSICVWATAPWMNSCRA